MRKTFIILTGVLFTLLFTACSQFHTNIEDYLGYWSTEATLARYSIDKPQQTNGEGVLCISSATDVTITIKLNNPKSVKLVTPTSSADAGKVIRFPGFKPNEQPEYGDTKDYTLKQTANDELELTYHSVFLKKHEWGESDISPQITLIADDGRVFKQTFTVKLKANTPPPLPVFTVAKTVGTSAHYVLCIRVPEMNMTVEGGLLHKDLARIEVNGTPYTFSVNEAEHTFVRPEADVFIMQSAVERLSGAEGDELPTGKWVLYYKTDVEVKDGAAKKDYTIKLIDEKGLVSGIVNASTKPNKAEAEQVRITKGTPSGGSGSKSDPVIIGTDSSGAELRISSPTANTTVHCTVSEIGGSTPVTYDGKPAIVPLPLKGAGEKKYKLEYYTDGEGFAATPVKTVYYKVLQEYTVSFDANGGAYPDGATVVFKTELYGTTISPPNPLPEKQGYGVDGWYNNAGTTGTAWNFGTDTVTGDITLYAQWTADADTPYKVEHYQQNIDDDNYPSAPTETKDKTGTTGASISADSIKENYEGFEYDHIDSIDPKIGADGKTVVKVFYKRKQITVTFKLDGGKIGGNSSDVTETGKYGVELTAPAPSTVKKPGYTCSSWQPVGDAPALSSTFPAKDAEYKANWTANTYYVQFNGKGNDGGSMDPQTFTYGVKQALSKNTFTKTGYTFKGWARNLIEGKKYDDEQEVTNLTPDANTTVVLHAVWEENNYKVRFNDGSGNMSDQNFRYTEYKALSENEFTKTGYDFDGWAKTPGGIKEYDDKEPVDKLTSENNGTVNLYARWKIKVYTVTFSVDGGHGTISATPQDGSASSTSPVSVEHDKTVTFTATPNEGYEVDSWTGVTASPSNSTTATLSGVTTNGIDVKVKFKLKKYTVKFSVVEGEGTLKGVYGTQTETAQDGGPEETFTDVPHGSTITFTAKPKYGWEVKGWTKGTDAVNGTAGSYTLTVTDNATIKVKFKKITTVNSTDNLPWKLLKKVVEIADNEAVITINGTIQATNNADNSGEITFGTLANKLTIQSGSSAVLDANGKSRIFKVEGGKTLTLKNLTLQNGAVPNPPYGSRGGGGGILVDGSTVRMTNCTIKDCKAGEQSTVGGAIRIEGAGAKVYIAGGEISGNRANRGGGISISGGKLYVNTDDSGNPNDSSTQTNITNNLVADNGFGYRGDGGAIYSDSNSELKLHKTKISRCGSKTLRNPSTTQGGGLYINGGTAVLTLVEISDGIFETIDGGWYQTVQGGAIYSENADVTLGKSGTPAYSCYIHHNTIRGNDSSGAFEGGGIYSYKGTLKIYGGKIEFNKVEGHLAKGGGIAQNETNLLLDGTVITDNTASYRGGGVDGLNIRSFTMEGSATVTPSTQTNTSTVKYNDVYLPRPLYRITIEGELTPVGGTAARITPEDYATTPPVLAGDITTGSNYTKFKVTPPNDSEVWKIDNNGCLKKQ